MSAFRRKRLPSDLVASHRAFLLVLGVLEPAKARLAEALPTNRLPGVPLVDALLEFESALARAHELMPAWRRPEVQEEWLRCDAGLGQALERATRLRLDAPDPGGFEGVLGTIQSLLDPLDPFEEASARFCKLRTRDRGRS